MIKNIGTGTAIEAINPNASFIVRGAHADGSLPERIEWLDGTAEISTANIDAKIVELEAEWDAQAYARNRKAEYDALNQFEMQYDDKKNSTTTWDDAIDAIKAKWPKDNSGPV